MDDVLVEDVLGHPGLARKFQQELRCVVRSQAIDMIAVKFDQLKPTDCNSHFEH